MNTQRLADGKVVHTVLSRQPFELELADITIDGRLEILPHVEERGLLSLRFKRRKLIVTPGAYIGLIPLTPSIVFDVRPKLPVSNLARVIDTARRSLSSISGTDRLYLTSDLAGGSVLEFLAANLVDALRPITANGLHKEYVRHSEVTGNPRGRIEVAGTVRAWSRGQFHKVQAQRSDQTSDIAPNRLIKAALGFVLRRVASRSPKFLAQANAAYMELPNVIGDLRPSDYDVSQKLLIAQRLPMGRFYYYRAIEIALLILSSRGIALQQLGTDVALESFIIDFDDLFEEYLRRILQFGAPDGLIVRDGNNEGKKPLFEDRSDRPAQPDAVLTWIATGRTAIGEIKYKERPEREDINQAIAYALSYGTDRAVLIHQSRPGGTKGMSHLGTIGGIRLATYAFDLGSNDLEREETAFAGAMYDLIRPRPLVEAA